MLKKLVQVEMLWSERPSADAYEPPSRQQAWAEASSGPKHTPKALFQPDSEIREGGRQEARPLVFREVKLPKRSGLFKCAHYVELLPPSAGPDGQDSQTVTFKLCSGFMEGGKLSLWVLDASFPTTRNCFFRAGIDVNGTL